MAREDLHFRLRIPENLKAQVEMAASQNHRSMTAEIVARLEDSFLGDDFRLKDPTPEAAPTAERRQIRELQSQYFESLSRENEALRKAGINAEQIVFSLASAITQAAQGNSSDLDRLVAREKAQPILKRLVTVSSIVGDE